MVVISRNGKSQLVMVDSGPKYIKTEIWHDHSSNEKSLDFRSGNKL